ncbi:MAG: hypothetical protein RR703_00005, partial [Bacilli bacterium]
MRRKKYKRITILDKIYYSERNQKLMLIILGLVFVIGLSLVYATLTTILSIKGNAAMRPYKDIRIVSVSSPTFTSGSYELYNAKYSFNYLISSASLPNIDSSITYTLKIKNSGTKDMLLKRVYLDTTNSNLDFSLAGIEVDNGTGVLNGVVATATEKDVVVTLKYKQGIDLPAIKDFETFVNFEFIEYIPDIMAPEILFNPLPGIWNNGNFNVALMAMDNVKVTDFKTCVNYSGSLCTPNEKINGDATAVIINQQSASIVVCAYAKDDARPINNSVTICNNIDIKKGSINNFYKLDSTAPLYDLNLSTESCTKNDVVATINVTDASVSGLPNLPYSFDGTYGISNKKNYVANTNVVTSVKDNAGNVTSKS